MSMLPLRNSNHRRGCVVKRVMETHWCAENGTVLIRSDSTEGTYFVALGYCSVPHLGELHAAIEDILRIEADKVQPER